MTRGFVVTGTDTGIGKTVFAAGLVDAIGAAYWKPVQSGLDGETDTETVTRLAQLPPGRIIPEVYRLQTPASPHISARIDGLTIDSSRLAIPPLSSPLPAGRRDRDPPLVVEGAGGLLVPLTDDTLYIDVMQRWSLPVILVARTRLGTINHTLLSVEALRRRAMQIHGVAFVGDPEPKVEETIVRMGKVRRLGRLPHLDHLDRGTLRAAFAEAFRAEDFAP